jgi:hypothetical protein
VVKDRLVARKQQRNLFAPVRSGVLGNEGPTSLNLFPPRARPLSCCLLRLEERRAERGDGDEKATASLICRTEQNRTGKMSMVKGVDELHTDTQRKNL